MNPGMEGVIGSPRVIRGGMDGGKAWEGSWIGPGWRGFKGLLEDDDEG